MTVWHLGSTNRISRFVTIVIGDASSFPNRFWRGKNLQDNKIEFDEHSEVSFHCE